jgi:hypothetical protein
MSSGFVAVIPRNDLPTEISRRARFPPALDELLRQKGVVHNATARTPATPVDNEASSSRRSTFFTDRANTRRDFDLSH